MIFAHYDEGVASRAVQSIVRGDTVRGGDINSVIAHVAALCDLAADPWRHRIGREAVYPLTSYRTSPVPVVGTESFVVASSDPRSAQIDAAREVAFSAGITAIRSLANRRLTSAMIVASRDVNIAMVGIAEATAVDSVFENAAFVFDRAVGQEANIAIAALSTVKGMIFGLSDTSRPTALEAATWLADQRVRKDRIQTAMLVGASAAACVAAFVVGSSPKKAATSAAPQPIYPTPGLPGVFF